MNLEALLRLRVLTARAKQLAGWAGLAGAGLMAVSLIWLGLAWNAHRVGLPEADVPALPVPPNLAGLQRADLAAPALPPRGEVPLLLTQIQQTVVSQGLAWTAADYKLVAATDTAPTTLEVRCSLKGTYPKLRSVVAQLLHKVPGLSVRDLNISRANSDIAEVDAKLTLGVFLQEDAATSQPSAEKSKP